MQLASLGGWPVTEHLVQHRGAAGADSRQAVPSLRGQAQAARPAVLAVGPARGEPEPLQLPQLPADRRQIEFDGGGHVGRPGIIVLLERGTCTGKQKALNAQLAGAAGVLIAHNVVGSPAPSLPNDTAITTPISIPTMSIAISNR